MHAFNPILFCIVLASPIAFGAEEDPFVGTWIEVVERHESQPVNTITFETSGETVKMTSKLGRPSEFVLDGVKRPIPTDNKTFRSAQGNSRTGFSRRVERDEKLISEATWTVSADEKMLIVTTTYYPPAGPQTQSYTYDRLSGSAGLNGSWQPKKLSQRSPELFIATETGEGLVIARGSGVKWIVDGRPRRINEGPAAIFNDLVLKRIGRQTIEKTGLKGGDIRWRGRLEIAADGKTLTETDEFISSNGTPITTFSVYEKKTP
jgi:hypothetical protein